MNFEDYLAQPLPFQHELESFYSTSDRLIIFEIGACEGEDTIKLRHRFPQSHIYAFEPLPKNIERMRRNYKKYNAPAIKINQVALSDNDGYAEFFVSSGHPDDLPKTKDWDYGNKSSSLLPPKEHKKIHKWVKFDKKIKVKTQRLDSFCKRHGISKIDFAFIDVQGAELKVLQGAGKFLKSMRIIWLEVEAVELYAGQPLKNEVEKYMESKGFKLLKSTVDNVAGDQLYINKRFSRLNKIQKLRFWNS